MKQIVITVPLAFDTSDMALYLGTVSNEIQDGCAEGYIDRDMWWKLVEY